MQNLKITIVQADLVWENIDANLKKFETRLQNINNTDLIVLPEMFNTGFSMNSIKLAENFKTKTFHWLQEKAEQKKAAIVTSFIVKENKKYYNRLHWINPDGSYHIYNKRHLFRMANEHNYYTPGETELIVNYKSWKIKPLVCYDLRFPVWSRNKQDYDALIYVANWPERRSKPWKILLKARAIENQAYVIGVNRVGRDGNNVIFSGDSAIINPYGEKISTIKPHDDTHETINISMQELIQFRKKFPVHLDADKFNINI